MIGQHDVRHGWFARWRRHRRAKRQEALEREVFLHERARCGGATTLSASTDLLNAHAKANAYGTLGMAFMAGLSGGGS